MNKETKAFLETVERRIEEIPFHIQRGLYQPIDPAKATLLERACGAFITKTDLVNSKAVEKAAQLAEEGESVTIVSAHRSNGDNGAIPFTVSKNGFESFAKSWIFLMGIKMWEDKYTRSMQGCLRTILTISPLEDRMFRDMLKNPDEYDLRESDISLIHKYKPLKEGLVAEGFKLTQELQRQGNPIFTYPETTRARGNHLQRAPREVAALFMKQPSWVLPLTVSGTERIFPVWSPAPVWIGPVTVTAGELVGSEELVAQYMKNKNEYGREVTVADYVMARIAVLDPGRVLPQDMALYRKLQAA